MDLHKQKPSVAKLIMFRMLKFFGVPEGDEVHLVSELTKWGFSCFPLEAKEVYAV